MNKINDTLIIPDVQSDLDERKISINKVGIKSIKHPVEFKLNENITNAIGTFEMYVNLPPTQKGTHMSRFVEILGTSPVQLNFNTFKTLTFSTRDKLEARDAFISVEFDIFLKKTAPVSGVESLLDYNIHLESSLENNIFSPYVTVKVPVKSLCPCSKGISDYGAHNQRSIITIKTNWSDDLNIFDLINVAETSSSCEIYGLLKRGDEKFVTEKAYDNPKFVEDTVRDISLKLNKLSAVSTYFISSENFESIHNHSAYAEIFKD